MLSYRVSDTDLYAMLFVVVVSGAVIAGAVALRGRSPTVRAARASWIRGRVRPLALVGAGAVMALLGVGMFAHAKAVSVERLDLAAMEAGARSDADYVEVRGVARPEHRLCRRGSGREQCYTPVTASATGTTVAVLLADDVLADDGATGAGRWTGFVSQSNQLSFRRHLEEAGLSPAEGLLRVLPESKAERARAGSWVSLAGLALLGLGWVWLRRVRAR